MAQSAKEKKIQIFGPPRPNNQWQSLSKNGFTLQDFQIDWENKQVTCPNGQTTTNWYPYLRQEVEHIRVRFKSSQCNGSEKGNLCTHFVREARSIGFANKDNYLILEEFRKIQDNPAWQKLYNQRAGIEGTFRKQ